MKGQGSGFGVQGFGIRVWVLGLGREVHGSHFMRRHTRSC